MNNRKAKPSKKEWALLAYIAGDNDLSDYGLVDIREMCRVGSSRRAHAAVQIDTKGEHDGSVRYEISEPDWSGKAHRIVIERLPESDSGAPETLRGFLKWGFGRYPAKNRLVVIWNHGSGFRTVRRDIAYDESGTSLDMPEITGVFRKAGIGPRSRIAVLGFDACLMNMLEIAHHFRNHASIIVGSQQTEPGDGWPYHRVLQSCNETKSPRDLAKFIVDAYIRDYQRQGEQGVTQSAVDTAKTGHAMKALSDLGIQLVRGGEKALRAVRARRLGLQSFAYADYVDAVHMGTVIGKAVTDPVVKNSAAELVKAVKACVISSKTYGAGVKNANGLSVWFPPQRDQYIAFRSKYTAMDFWKNHKGWVRFLDAYYA